MPNYCFEVDTWSPTDPLGQIQLFEEYNFSEVRMPAYWLITIGIKGLSSWKTKYLARCHCIKEVQAICWPTNRENEHDIVFPQSRFCQHIEIPLGYAPNDLCHLFYILFLKFTFICLFWPRIFCTLKDRTSWSLKPFWVYKCSMARLHNPQESNCKLS